MTRIQAINALQAAVNEYEIDMRLCRSKLPGAALFDAVEAIQNGANPRTVVDEMEAAAR